MPSAGDGSVKAGTPRRNSTKSKTPIQSDDLPLVLPSHSRSESPDSRVSSARSRRTDPAGLITDLTRLKEITHDERIQSPTYRKLLGDFGPEELPETAFHVEQEGIEPRDTVFFGGDIEGQIKEDEDEIEDIEDDLDEEFGEDLDNISSIGSDEEARAAEYDTDLEVDADKLIFPEKYDHDTTGKSVYLKKCEEIGVQPITYFINHMQDTQLVMKHHSLGPQGMKAIAKPLEVNTVIEKIDLEGNYILGEGAIYLTKVLRENVYVTELILCDNKIGNDGAQALCELLSENKTIIHLNLTGNDIEDSAAEAFYEMLTRNASIKTLMLRHNKFEDVGAQWFHDSMNENVTLETLDLSFNRFQNKGCVLLAQALKDNVGLKYLDISMNGFGLEGARALEGALKENKYLTDLNISYCRIPDEAAVHIAGGLQHNDTLEKLNIGYNPLQEDGADKILTAVHVNQSSVLKLLDFGILMVKKSFKELEGQLAEERGLKTIYGGVLPDCPRTKLRGEIDAMKLFMRDPMAKLKAYVEKEGYRMVDLLKSFDRDQSFTISLEELKEGVRRCNIDLTDPQISQLMKQLDKDGNGEIDFSELLQGNDELILKKRAVKKFMQANDQKKSLEETHADSKAEPKSYMSMLDS
ncbi:leucine-rich repeat-containing protein 74A-like [Saccostrea echinata]|uniref:leucine-rich repeat-containing protein 74A-like n=1 Tax=Saccostrea echinata TaxID=191078 RepID=UPI002A7F8F7C|nr:leucine-rich repeat-containing protein 74A-like [Saccostrea echinata]